MALLSLTSFMQVCVLTVNCSFAGTVLEGREVVGQREPREILTTGKVKQNRRDCSLSILVLVCQKEVIEWYLGHDRDEILIELFDSSQDAKVSILNIFCQVDFAFYHSYHETFYEHYVL